MQIDFPAYYFLAFIPVFWRVTETVTAEPGEREEAEGSTCNPCALSIPTHRVGSSSNKNPRISSEPGLGTCGAGCGSWHPQNSQGKMFSHWCGTACAWVALLQNVPQVTASAWVECLTHANVLLAWTAGVIPFIKTHGSRPCSSRNCHSSSSSKLLIC